MTPDSHPVVSVIVPARNEEANLATCLQSLIAQSGINYEVIVVDDSSTDRSAEIAQSFLSNVYVGADALVRPPVHLVSAPPLPPNWTGKNNAMATGAKIAKGKWLLFTDADTVHKPGSLARAVKEAEGHQADLLSYSPEQEARTFWEKAIMPVIFAELAATYPPKKVNDPASPIAAANGQYLMISRAAYEAIGRHAAIAGDLLEDVAMARLVKSSGRRILFRYGGDAVRTRMYRNWPQMKEGWTKNLALLFTRPMERALLWFFVWMLAWISLLLGLLAITSGHWKFAYLLLPVAFLYARIAAGKFPVPANLVAFAAGIPVAAYLLMCSALMKKKGGIVWKGRKYSATSA